MERKKLSSLKNTLRSKGVRLQREKAAAYLGFSVEGAFGRKLLFTVKIDDLFDGDGNRFEDDLP